MDCGFALTCEYSEISEIIDVDFFVTANFCKLHKSCMSCVMCKLRYYFQCGVGLSEKAKCGCLHIGCGSW